MPNRIHFWKWGAFFKISTNEGIEVEVGRDENFTTYFNEEISWTRHIDHAGLRIELEICGFWFRFCLYDFRHWDSKNKRYESS